MTNSCFFHSACHSLLSHILVHRVRRDFFPFGPEFMINSDGMSSSPGAFPDFRCLIASSTSLIKGGGSDGGFCGVGCTGGTRDVSSVGIVWEGLPSILGDAKSSYPY
ncbi:hypothetical protein RRG08_052008 [Elysia crispata]|uniref:Uncharacterized protein n=1 Tax=Elysia crispata TaxID=231223 RepID=A0AAE0ZCQ0_9GAST|nr:hypothetical protein RRG08_052008 [Elysia crispata]